MSRYGVWFVMPLIVALALSARAPVPGVGWADAGAAGSVQADRSGPQPGATHARITGGAAVKVVSQGRGQKAPGLDRVKPVQRLAGPASFEIVGQGAGPPGSDRKPTGVRRETQQPRMIGEGVLRAGWTGATVDGKKQKASPAVSAPVKPNRR